MKILVYTKNITHRTRFNWIQTLVRHRRTLYTGCRNRTQCSQFLI